MLDQFLCPISKEPYVPPLPNSAKLPSAQFPLTLQAFLNEHV